MPASAAAAKTSSKSAEHKSKNPKPIADYALLFELETIGLESRKPTFKIIQKAFKAHGIEVSAPTFSRYCLNGLPDLYIPALIEGLELPSTLSEPLTSEIKSQLSQYFASTDIKLRSGIEKLIKIAITRSIPIGALSTLPAGQAEDLMRRLGLFERGITLYRPEINDASFPRLDLWIKMARFMGKVTKRSAALVSSKASCRAAISVGMRCIVVPDEYTVFQDFGGAETVIDNLEKADHGELLTCWFPKATK